VVVDLVYREREREREREEREREESLFLVTD